MTFRVHPSAPSSQRLRPDEKPPTHLLQKDQGEGDQLAVGPCPEATRNSTTDGDLHLGRGLIRVQLCLRFSVKVMLRLRSLPNPKPTWGLLRVPQFSAVAGIPHLRRTSVSYSREIIVRYIPEDVKSGSVAMGSPEEPFMTTSFQSPACPQPILICQAFIPGYKRQLHAQSLPLTSLQRCRLPAGW